MLTQCPQCGAVFRLRAEHLRAARGFVACGACDHVFNVLTRVVDEPKLEHDHTRAASAPGFSDKGGSAARAPILPDVAGEAVLPDVFAAPPPAQGPQLGSEDALEAVALEMPPLFRDVHDAHAATAAAPNASLLPESEYAILFEAPSETAGTAEPPRAARHDEDDVPEILREELAALAGQKRARARWLWALVALVLLVGLAAQVSFAYREALFERWPVLKPWAELLCARLGCDLRVPLATGTIELLSRDVRDHPQYAGTLLVNATLHNKGSRPAAYPVIQLGIYNQTGNVIGVRRFAPKEYLDQSIDIDAGLPAGGSVYLVLEIAGAGNSADSFEFTFL